MTESNDALVEELARAMGGNGLAFTNATAILPIIARLTAEARAKALDEAANACEAYMADCLEDRDVQKGWPQTLARNRIYAQLVRNLKGTDNG